jgi:hypothetical protein
VKNLVFMLFACALVASSQGTTSRLDGTVSDPQGAVIIGAEIAVVNASTGQTFKAITDSRGEWVIPSVPSATYRVTVTKAGFKSTTFEGVKMDAGVPATVNAKLEIGQLAEVVEVTAGGEIVQTENATVNTTLQGRQIFELPFNTRNALDLLVTQPGTQTASGSRATFVNGLPQSAINITVDGLNDQDNQQKSGAGGFFTVRTIWRRARHRSSSSPRPERTSITAAHSGRRAIPRSTRTTTSTPLTVSRRTRSFSIRAADTWAVPSRRTRRSSLQTTKSSSSRRVAASLEPN